MVSTPEVRPLYMLDTCVCVDLLRGRVGKSVLPQTSQTAISSVVAAELWTGWEKMGRPARKLEPLQVLLETVPVIDFSAEAAQHYGEIRAYLEKKGTPIGPMDLLIAAHARSIRATLITANVGEFKRVPKLKCRGWK